MASNPIKLRRLLLVWPLAVASLVACKSDGPSASVPAPPVVPAGGTQTTPINWAAPTYAASWEIGPIIDGVNRSSGVPLNPSAHADGLSFDFPWPDAAAGRVGYVTFRHGPLTGKQQIRMRYRIEMESGTQIYPKCCAGMQSSIVLYFQRRGDDWRTDGWRWWSTFAYHAPLAAGEFELVAPLEGNSSSNWTSVISMSALSSPGPFRAAIDNADRVGFTFGGGDGWGHGVYATGPARFVLLEFRVE